MIKPILLASASPRRVEILRSFSLPFEVVPHTFDERQIPWNGSGATYATQLAEAKAKTVASHHDDRIIVAADTIVVINGHVLNKPTSLQEAKSMLKELSGKWHQVITGISVMAPGSVQTRHDETRVLLAELTDDQIHAYLSQDTYADKAGAYAIQGSGAILVQRIEGCYYNVIGLPVRSLSSMLENLNIDLWQYL